MDLNVELLSRIQFAVTVGFHFIFPPITIGLAWFLVVIEGIGWRKNNLDYVKLGKFFGKLLALTFAVGVATGIVMEFQFGTNWSQYSKFVGDIFGAPLAAEGVIAFFLESGFLGLYLFGRDRVSKGTHWFSILMVAVGSTISAFWILVANSWQQTPAGYKINDVTHRAELTNFADAVFNPSTMIRFLHTVDAALITGAFFIIGISAYLILRKQSVDLAKISMKVGLFIGLVASCLEIFPLGHMHSVQVAETQPEKFAAICGVYQTGGNAPFTLFAIPNENPPKLYAKIEIPGMLSWLLYGDANATVKGTDQFQREELPPLALTVVSYHTMAVLGTFFVAVLAFGVFLLWRGSLWNTSWLMRVFVWSIPLPLLACQLGWIAAEVGRQPWIVYHIMRTRDAFSPILSGGEVLFSLILLSAVYLLLGILYVYLLKRKLKAGPEAVVSEEVYHA